jgi:hypothetical protein
VPGRAGLLLRAPFDWLGVAGWGVRTRAHDPRVLVQGVVLGEAGVLLALRRELRGWELPGGRAERLGLAAIAAGLRIDVGARWRGDHGA